MTTEHILIICAILGLIAGCAVGYYAGLNVGRIVAVRRWGERCRQWEQKRQAAQERARRDARTGRYRKAQP
jgi:membrane protein DedA with SNARE-associated domain